MKFLDLLQEVKLSGELERAKKLFINNYNTFLKGKSRELRLKFILEVINAILSKADIKFLILDLQREYNKKKKE